MLTTLSIPALTDNYIYVLHDDYTGQTAVIDPAQAEPVLELLEARGWELDYILNTHHHHDHIGGNLALEQATGCRIIGSKVDQHRIPAIDIAVVEGDDVVIGANKGEVLFMPGHTLGHIAFYFPRQQLLFCGDTLFGMGCGRLFEGTAEQLWQSLQRLKALPAATKVYCSHEYTQSNGRFALTVEPGNPQLQARMHEVNELRSRNQSTLPSTIGLELATNPFLREDSPEIRRHLNMENAAPVEVFAQLRRLKDNFK